MSHEITLEQATERAHQSEIVCRLIESYPHQLESGEVTALASLLARLTGNVTTWLMEEQAQREALEANIKTTSEEA
ncbi:hypothetical protein HP437_22455 [Serratia marcescens]|uniref:hypothetical protein n=1 Tax=Serratia marcescens TaxID=615 RepID=UPI0015D853F0|nr:hypothetical protein [Serratia marcescens]QLJ67773.1 hypothetical protein HP437_22455 [Serratia marcescens]